MFQQLGKLFKLQQVIIIKRNEITYMVYVKLQYENKYRKLGIYVITIYIIGG